MYKKIKWYPGYVIDPETLKVIWKKGNELKPYKYPNSNCLRVSLYKDWVPTYVWIKDIVDRMWLWNDNWTELQEYFIKRDWKKVRKDSLYKKFEKYFIDEALEEWVIVRKVGIEQWFYIIFNPDRLC